MIKLIIDGDPMVYRSGFAAQSAVYEIVYENEAGIGEFKFDRTDGHTALANFKEWKTANADCVILQETKTVRAEPVSHALQLVKRAIVDIEGEIYDKFKGEINTQVILSGPGNYRESIATIRPYKGNRDPSHIPVHYNSIRQYMIDQYCAQVIHGREADDEVSIRGWQHWRATKGVTSRDGEGLYVVATIDKDLDQIPGWHFDYMKKVFYFVTEEQAEKALWRQILCGDITDNIPGCWRMGPVRAAELVDGMFELQVEPKHMWEAVIEEYQFSKLKPGCPYMHLDSQEVAIETAHLVYMQRQPGQLWAPPGVPFGYVKGAPDD